MDKKTGGCHCKRVRYEVELDLSQPVIECNCSHCEAKGMLLSFVPEEKFSLLEGESELTDYRFNKGLIAHLFCKHCGVQAFGKGSGPNGPTVAINVRTIDGVDVSTLIRKPFNGKEY